MFNKKIFALDPSFDDIFSPLVWKKTPPNEVLSFLKKNLPCYFNIINALLHNIGDHRELQPNYLLENINEDEIINRTFFLWEHFPSNIYFTPSFYSGELGSEFERKSFEFTQNIHTIIDSKIENSIMGNKLIAYTVSISSDLFKKENKFAQNQLFDYIVKKKNLFLKIYNFNIKSASLEIIDILYHFLTKLSHSNLTKIIIMGLGELGLYFNNSFISCYRKYGIGLSHRIYEDHKTGGNFVFFCPKVGCYISKGKCIEMGKSIDCKIGYNRCYKRPLGKKLQNVLDVIKTSPDSLLANVDLMFEQKLSKKYKYIIIKSNKLVRS